MTKPRKLDFLPSSLELKLDAEQQNKFIALHQPIVSERTAKQVSDFADQRIRFWFDLERDGKELGLNNAALIFSRSPFLRPPPPPPPDDGDGQPPIRDFCSRSVLFAPYSFGAPSVELISPATDITEHTGFARKVAQATVGGGFSLLAAVGTMPQTRFEADDNNGAVTSAFATIYQVITVPFSNVPVAVSLEANFNVPLDPRICVLHPDQRAGLTGLAAQQSLVELDVSSFSGLSNVLDSHVFISGLALRINPGDEFDFFGELTPDSFIHFNFTLRGNLVVDTTTDHLLIAAFTCKTFNMLGGPVASSGAFAGGDFRDQGTVSNYLFSSRGKPGPVVLNKLSVEMCPLVAFPTDPSL